MNYCNLDQLLYLEKIEIEDETVPHARNGKIEKPGVPAPKIRLQWKPGKAEVAVEN